MFIQVTSSLLTVNTLVF